MNKNKEKKGHSSKIAKTSHSQIAAKPTESINTTVTDKVNQSKSEETKNEWIKPSTIISMIGLTFSILFSSMAFYKSCKTENITKLTTSAAFEFTPRFTIYRQFSAAEFKQIIPDFYLEDQIDENNNHKFIYYIRVYDSATKNIVLKHSPYYTLKEIRNYLKLIKYEGIPVLKKIYEPKFAFKNRGLTAAYNFTAIAGFKELDNNMNCWAHINYSTDPITVVAGQEVNPAVEMTLPFPSSFKDTLIFKVNVKYTDCYNVSTDSNFYASYYSLDNRWFFATGYMQKFGRQDFCNY